MLLKIFLFTFSSHMCKSFSRAYKPIGEAAGLQATVVDQASPQVLWHSFHQEEECIFPFPLSLGGLETVCINGGWWKGFCVASKAEP